MQTHEKGFTIIEVLIAITVLGIGILALQMMQVTSINTTAKAAKITSKSMLASSKIEEILSLKYTHQLLDDSDLDGTDQDLNDDGLDDQDDGNSNTTNLDEEFGLRHSQCCPGGIDPWGGVVEGCVEVADQCDVYEDYEIYWNVAVDYPLVNTKTITIIVIDTMDKVGQQADVTNLSPNRAEYTYIKNDVI